MAAAIQRMSSGTRVPRPRTWRSIGPRFTVSIQTAERSTLGAAGFNRETDDGDQDQASTEAPPMISRRFRFLAGDIAGAGHPWMW